MLAAAASSWPCVHQEILAPNIAGLVASTPSPYRQDCLAATPLAAPSRSPTSTAAVLVVQADYYPRVGAKPLATSGALATPSDRETLLSPRFRALSHQVTEDDCSLRTWQLVIEQHQLCGLHSDCV
jgi:hypothetical protein